MCTKYMINLIFVYTSVQLKIIKLFKMKPRLLF